MQGLETKVRHIHRLDKDTTGGVVFAKHRIAGSIMDRLLMERKIKRTYAALVEGKVKKKQGKIDAAIGRIAIMLQGVVFLQKVTKLSHIIK